MTFRLRFAPPFFFKTERKMIKLGQKVRDKITGFQGTITAKAEYYNGCIQYCITPPVDKDGKMREAEYFDVDQIEIIEEATESISKPSGGGIRNTPNTKYSG